MKTRLVLLIPLCLATAASVAWGVRLGDTRAAVIDELGAPAATAARADGIETLTYPIGEVRLRAGVVCYVLLTDGTEPASAAAAAERAAQLRIAELEARLAAARTRLALAEAEVRAARAASALVPGPLRPPEFPAPAARRPPAADALMFAGSTQGL